MKKYSVSAAVVAGLLAGGLSIGSAQAADLGGNCCADLEERVAELEATTVRKGNRKVSLTISGWVAEQVMWWDDGVESNTYVTGLGTTLSSHFKLTGAAQIAPGWSAGYVIHIEAGTADPLASLNQDTDEGNSTVRAHQSYWFLKSETLGKLSVGLMSPPSDNAAILVDGSGSLVPANWVLFDNQAFFVNINGQRVAGGRNWGDYAHCQSWGTGGLGGAGDCGAFAGPANVVRYDSPTFGGFSVSASWGEDDMWDVAGRYAGELGGFKLAVAAAYFSQNDRIDTTNLGNTSGNDTGSNWQIGAYIEHMPTGLFAYGAYGADLDTPNPNFDLGADRWYVKAGIRQRWTSLGHTVLYGEYGIKNDSVDCGILGCAPGGLVTGSELKQWGLGIVQEIDAAAMSLWVSYRRFDLSEDCSPACSISLENGGSIPAATHHEFDGMHVVKAGALINF